MGIVIHEIEPPFTVADFDLKVSDLWDGPNYPPGCGPMEWQWISKAPPTRNFLRRLVAAINRMGRGEKD